MSQDQSKKSLRNFQCREYLWEIFEQMSAELECSTDYLINEAMRQYARSRNYGNRTPGLGSVPRVTTNVTGSIPSLGRPGSAPARPAIPSAPPPPQARTPGYPGAYAGGPPSGTFPHPSARPGAPPVGAGPYGVGGGAPMPPGRAPVPPPPSSYPPARPTGTAPPPLPRTGPAGHAGMPSLYVVFNGQKVPVAKDEFVIGRGSKSADLAIKDGNISRRHAAVVFQGGAFYMKDLGSTNGVEFHGQRVDSKLIEEGDVYHLCDYELRFTYR